MSGHDMNVWIETIKADEIVLTDGEFKLTLEVMDSTAGTDALPDIFQAATIQDQFEVGIRESE